jgi:thiol-disulfide isomerase/thioredoxin/uncharacterized membrane protein YphA (DoxX/SURF4 family)
MDIFLLILRLILAAVFSVAAFAKLFDRSGAEKAFAGFGMSKAVRAPLAILLPMAELAVALALLFVSTSWYAAGGAAILLIAFLAGMFFHLTKGNAPDCHCFGQLHSEPVGLSSVVRNIVLLAVAGFLLGQGHSQQGLSLVNRDQDVMFVFFGLSILGLLAIIIFYLLRISTQQGELANRLEAVMHDRDMDPTVEREGVMHPSEGLPIGAKFPDFELPGLNGDIVDLQIIKAATMPALFIFISPTCNPCRSLVPEFERWQEELNDRVTLVFVSTGGPSVNEEKFGDRIKRKLLLQKNRELADRAKAKWTPTAVLVDRHGRVASHAAAGDTAIRDLVDRIKSEDLQKDHVYFSFSDGPGARNKVGEKVPDFSVKDVNGKEITNSFFENKTTLVTFWGLDCGHCKNFLEDLKKWDISRTNGDPEMIVFSDGDPEANAELGFRSPTIPDPGHKVAGKFGMFGTPSAILVDGQGTIISETAIGAPGIWALVGKES